RLIEKNTSIPKEAKQIFTTAADNQPAVTISVFQGESEISRSPSNRLLGEFNLEGIRPAARGTPQIEVTFSIDKNGGLEVKAKDVDRGKEANIKIEGSSGLDPKEVERMRKEAEAHAAEDKRKLELIGARNEADAVIYELEKVLKEHESKIGASEKEAVRSAIERTKQAAGKDDAAAIRQAVSDLKVAAQSLAQYVQGG